MRCSVPNALPGSRESASDTRYGCAEAGGAIVLTGGTGSPVPVGVSVFEADDEGFGGGTGSLYEPAGLP